MEKVVHIVILALLSISVGMVLQPVKRCWW